MYEGTVVQLRNMDNGNGYYVTQPATVEDILTELRNAWVTGNPTELSYGYDCYRVYILSDEQKEGQDVYYTVYPKEDILSKTIDTKDGIFGKTKEIQSENLEVSAETMQNIMTKLETIEKTYRPYEILYIQGVRGVSVDYADINKLGMVLNDYLHVFQNAFIDANGTLQVSLEDWNTILSSQYGNTKNLIYQNGTIKNNALPTNISYQNINGKVYIPLREAVNHFGHLSMEWDKQMRKAVIADQGIALK